MKLFRKKLANGQPSPTWWFRVRIGGQVIQRSTGESRHRAAETLARRTIADLQRQYRELAPATPGPAEASATPDPGPAPASAESASQLPGLDSPPAPAHPRTKLTPEQKQLATLLVAAHAGQMPWLEEAIKDSGYQRDDTPSSVVTLQQFAELTDVSKPTVWNWISRGLPKAPESNGVTRVDLRRAIAWLIVYYQDQVKQARATAQAAADQSRNRAGSAKAELIEIELAEKRGQVVPTEAHWRFFLAWCNRFVAALRSKPAGWAQACQGEPALKIRELLDHDLEAIFADLRQADVPDNIPPAAAEHFRAALAAITQDRKPTPEDRHVRSSQPPVSS